jgi:transcription elongation GreA/GreB family factor
MGSAVLGKRIGETVVIQAPRGSWQARIIEIRAA